MLFLNVEKDLTVQGTLDAQPKFLRREGGCLAVSSSMAIQMQSAVVSYWRADAARDEHNEVRHGKLIRGVLVASAVGRLSGHGRLISCGIVCSTGLFGHAFPRTDGLSELEPARYLYPHLSAAT